MNKIFNLMLLLSVGNQFATGAAPEHPFSHECSSFWVKGDAGFYNYPGAASYTEKYVGRHLRKSLCTAFEDQIKNFQYCLKNAECVKPGTKLDEDMAIFCGSPKSNKELLDKQIFSISYAFNKLKEHLEGRNESGRSQAKYEEFKKSKMKADEFESFKDGLEKDALANQAANEASKA